MSDTKAAAFSFYDMAPGLAPMSIVDVGAAIVDRLPPYQGLLDAGHPAVIGFEPNAQAYEKLQMHPSPSRRIYPYFIGDGTAGTYHQTNVPQTGSLYPVNTSVVARFTNLPLLTVPVAQHPVQTRRLDDAVPDTEIDFLKMDVQGAELDVLRGAPRLVSTALVVETEVEFVPLYTGQPLFADIDGHMRSSGFQLHALRELNKYYYTPMKHPSKLLRGINQVIWADAVYFPTFERIATLPGERILKLAALMHDLYGSVDLALHLLQILEQRDGTSPFAA